MGNGNRFSQEMKERSVRLVFDQVKGNEPTWPAIVSVSAKIGCSAETLRRWVRQAERDSEKREELEMLRRDVRDLDKASEALRLAAILFAQAERDRQK